MGRDSTQALTKLFEKNLLGIHASELQEVCDCNNGYTEGFCSSCQEMVCPHCGFKELTHPNCGIHCLNCQCGNSDSICAKCGEPACLRCGKVAWIHEHQFCKIKEQKIIIGLLEVDHDCWFSNLSEKHQETIVLNSFSDKKDGKLQTHSGMLKIDIDDKHKIISSLNRQDILKEAKLVHKANKTHYIRTRAAIDKSVDKMTKANQSILLNPIIANDSKEQNLILSPSEKEMKKLSKCLQEFGGKTKIVASEEFSMKQMENSKIQEFIEKVPRKELLDSVQKIRVRKLGN